MMKKYWTFFICLLAIFILLFCNSKLFPEIAFNIKKVDDRTPFYTGKEASFIILNSNEDNFKFTNANYQIQVENKVPEKIVTTLTDEGLRVNITMPYSFEVIGKNSKMIVLDNYSNIIGHVTVAIEGLEPSIQTQTGQYLYRGDSFKNISLSGKNLSSIKEISFENNSIIIDEFFGDNAFKIDSDKLILLNVRANNNHINDQHKIRLKYKTINDENRITTFMINIPIYSNEYPTFTIENNKIYLEDITNNDDFVLNIELPQPHTNENYTLTADDKNILIPPFRLINFQDNNRGSIGISIDPAIRVGSKMLYINDENKPKYISKLLILDNPKLSKIYLGSKKSTELKLNPYLNKQQIIVEGDNLSDLTLICENEFIIFTENSRSTNKKKIFDVSFTAIDDIIPGKYSIGFRRTRYNQSTVDYTEFSNNEINIVEPQKTCALDNIIQLVSDNDKVLSFYGEQPLHVDVNSRLLLQLNGKDLSDDYGAQAVNIKAKLFDADGKLLEIREYKNERLNSTYALIGTKNSKYARARPTEQWDLEKEFYSQLYPWRKINIEIRHDKNYYQETDEIPDYTTKNILIEGGFRDNFYSTITLPPILIATNFKKTQIIPLNVGYGIKYEHRNKDGKKIFISPGIYAAGLNNLGSGAIEDTTSFLGKNSAALLFLVEFKLLNKETNLQLPFQIGGGRAWSTSKSRPTNVVVFGLGIAYTF